MRLTFLVSLVGMALLYVTLWKYEMASKHARMQLARCAHAARRRRGRPGAAARRRHERAASLPMPALPLHEAGKYVAARLPRVPGDAADLRGDHGHQLVRIERELSELRRDVDARRASGPRAATASEAGCP